MKHKMRTILSRTRWFIPLLLITLLGLLPPAAGAEKEDKAPPANTEKQEPELEEWLTLEHKSEETPLTEKEEKQRSWLGTRIMKRIIKAGQADFILAGEVVDEDGNRLKEVPLLISKYKSLGPERGVEDDEERVIDGTFSVRARGYTYVYLYFRKEGYYWEKMEFSCDEEDDPFSRDYNPDRKLDRRNIRIVLEKKGDITRLIEKDFTLIYRRQEDGTVSGRVVNFDRDRWPRGYYFQKPRNPILVTNLLDPEVIPPMCVYMIPKVDDEGRILTKTKTWGKGRWDKETYPKELRLITSDPEGGFIVYEQEEGEWASWSMKLAPESGYKQELILEPDRFNERSFIQPDAGIYFYFKINDRYGKGRISIPTLPEGDYALEMKTEFRMQIDGSRNLDTGRR